MMRFMNMYCEGRPTASLPEDNPVKQALRKIVDNLNL